MPAASSQRRYSPKSSPAVAISSGRSPSSASVYAMFGAQPPRRFTIESTRKLRLTRFMCSGRKCSVNLPGNDIR